MDLPHDQSHYSSLSLTPQTIVTTVTPPPRPGAVSLLPHRISIPDGYADDFDTDPPRFVDPVNRDRIVALDLLGRPRGGWTACAAYDEEKRGPFKGTADVLRLVLEFRF